MEINLAKNGGDLGAISARLRSQVCVIGGGIAGLILAHRLSAFCTVTLLEAGGRVRTGSDGEDPFSAELRGRPHAGTYAGRVRSFGGCSLTWGGQLLALPDDAAWPIAATEIREQGAAWQIPTRAAEFLAERGAALPSLMEEVPGLEPRLSRFVPFSLRNLARRPGRELLASKRVKVVLHAPVREILLAETRDRIGGVEVVTPDGRVLRVEAEQYVLAAGTVETCRLLLASRSVASEGIGNAFGQVGRNFHDHLTIAAAEFGGMARTRVLEELRPWVLPSKRQQRAVYSLKLEASARLREERGLRPAMAHLTVEEPAGSGVGALRGWLRGRQEGSGRGGGMGAVPDMVGQALRLAWEARVKQRRYVSPAAKVRLQINTAQDAPSASRIYLSQEKDALGLPRAIVDWCVSEGEIRSLRRFAAYLRERFEAMGYRDGVIWESSLLAEGPAMDAALLERLDDARHAMGGACMGTDPRASAVDPALRVHGVRNLSVASAAVFPDGSAQLPTLTLSALCVRLAERLGRELA